MSNSVHYFLAAKTPIECRSEGRLTATMHSLKLCAVANCGLVWMVDFARCTGDRVKLSWT